MFDSFRLKKLRNSRNLTLKELSERVKISQTYLNQMENGAREPTLRMLEKLAKFYGINLSYFFVREEKGEYSVGEPESEEILKYLNKLSAQQKKNVLNYIKFEIYRLKKEEE